MLTADELERYARHIVLREVGGPGQGALNRQRALVVVIGAGGLGAPALLYLAAAGVGTIAVVDDDAVSLSNLQRQVIHGTPEIGQPKTQSAVAAIRRLNPHVSVTAHQVRLTAANAVDLISEADIVADGSDNFATRYLVSDACFFAKRPLVTAAVGTFDATLTTIRALEVIREIGVFGEGLVGLLLMIDARSLRFETLSYGWDENNPLSGKNPTIRKLDDGCQMSDVR